MIKETIRSLKLRIFNSISSEVAIAIPESSPTQLLESPLTQIDDIEILQKNRIIASGLFDPEYYAKVNIDLHLSTDDLIDHFIKHGGPEGRNAHPLFDAPYYLSLYEDVKNAKINPLYHYLEYGAPEGRAPHPLFDPVFYQAQVSSSESLTLTSLEHFLKIGAKARLDPNPYFSSNYYLAQYGSLFDEGTNPLAHYWTDGAAAGLDPHPLFMTNYYLEANPDVASSKINPLHHYLLLGRKEGRDTIPLFDASWYSETFCPHQDVLVNASDHYRQIGAAKGFDPSPALCTAHYLRLHPEIKKEKLNALDHLLARFNYEVSKKNCRQFAPLRLWLRDLYSEQSNVERHGPLISFILPCFNQGEWLEDALISAHLSTRCPLEIIVIDDGSYDTETLRLLPELTSTYHAQLVTQKNCGLSSARNAALRIVRGEYIQFLDSDDLLLPNKVDSQMDLGDADVYISDYYLSNALCGGWRAPFPSTIKGFSLSYDSFLRNWERGLSIPIHCGLFSRNILHNFQFAEEVKAKEDWLMWLNVIKKNPTIRYLDTPSVLYRQHYRNMGRNAAQMGEAYLRSAFRIAQENNDPTFLDFAFKHFRELYVERIKMEAVHDDRTVTV
jgi:glycosyltransferase involved in cell wall biosynthesis